MIACGNTNAQNYLGASYPTAGDATCSGEIGYFNYVVGGKCITSTGTSYSMITMGTSKYTIKTYPSTDSDCSGTATSTSEQDLKCTSNTKKSQNVTTSSSFSSASSLPAGKWFISRTYKSSSCTDVQVATGRPTGCTKVGTTGSKMMKEDSSTFDVYTYTNTDCSGAGTKYTGLSYKKDTCVAVGGGSKMYAKYTIEEISAISSSSVASFNAFMLFALIIMSITLQ